MWRGAGALEADAFGGVEGEAGAVLVEQGSARGCHPRAFTGEVTPRRRMHDAIVRRACDRGAQGEAAAKVSQADGSPDR